MPIEMRKGWKIVASTGVIDPAYMKDTLFFIWPYLKVTISLTLLAVLLGGLLGLAGAIGELMGGPVVRRIIRLYVLVCRSLPNLVLLYLVYYGLPILLLALHQEWGIHLPYEHISAYFVAVLGLGLHTGAYLTESFRAAILSVSEGQVEAAKALGMTWREIFQRVVIPQASVFAIPLLANQVLSTMKSTSIVFIITVMEILGAAKLFCEGNSRYFEAYIVVALLYWGMGAILEILFHRLEWVMGKYKRGSAL